MARNVPAPDTVAMRASIRSMRRKLVARIRTLVAPHFHESGFSKHLDRRQGLFGPKRPLLIWVPRDRSGQLSLKPVRIGGVVLDGIEGISEDGPITDGEAGGIVITGWGLVPLEDLLRVEAWAAKTFAGPEMGQPARMATA